MTVHYITRENEMLDYICLKHYGYSSGAVDTVSINYPYQQTFGIRYCYSSISSVEWTAFSNIVEES